MAEQDKNVTSFIADKKRQYLIKTFSRTERKDYENYVLCAIWHRLNNINIQPVTQQYIKLNDSKYGLIDLYFPQINLGIECDEFYHEKNIKRDEIREINIELSMEKMLSAYEKENDFILYRVEAYLSIDEIDKQVDEIILEINKRIKDKNIINWEVSDSDYEKVIQKGSFAVNDNYSFRTIVDIAKCFGKDYKAMQRCYFTIAKDYKIWCPKLAIEKAGDLCSATNSGWLNTLSKDWNTIKEWNDKRGIKVKDNENTKRILFAKSRDELGRNTYKFIGVFLLINKKKNVIFIKELDKNWFYQD